VSAELRQLRGRCDAFDALVDALRTPDGWLSYRAMALRDQLHESARQDPARPSTLEQICTALIDRDEALRQARADLEKMRTLAANWEAEVAGVRNDNLELHSLLRGAQAQQSQAEERACALEQKAKEADDLKAALDAKVATSPSRRTSSCRSVPPARGPRGGSSRSGLPLPTPGRHWSSSASLARRCRSRWRGGTQSSRSSRAS
jgi:chromosome segregation ATPase